MQVVSHSLSHRGPSASRTRARWQPYASIPPPSLRTPSSAYLHTPASSSSFVSTPAPTLQIPACESDLPKSLPPSRSISHILSQPSKDIREVHKHKYVTGLVDAAVKSLCDIWDPHDVPTVFLTQACSATLSTSMNNILPLNGSSNSNIFTGHAQQLPSPPITPPYLTNNASSLHTATAPRNLSRVATHIDLSSAEQARGNIVPLKTFVHEVLRRSRTSYNVLQTALCYIEALRSKVPELVHQERTGDGIRGEVDQSARVLFPDDPRLQEPQKEVDIDEVIDLVNFAGLEGQFSDDTPPTVRMLDDNPVAMPDVTTWQSKCEVEKKPPMLSEDLPALPPLPSPLLCPRRTFLASLILASKFMQDKCYSNRAWAKLAGLPAREIGRCERALGEALEWRLWVGKMPVQRVLPRSQSSGELFCSRINNRTNTSSDVFLPVSNTLRRRSTLPSHAFSLSAVAVQPTNPSTIMSTTMQGPWMPTPEANTSEYSPTPTLSASPAITDASSDSLSEERTVQMTFVDHVPNPDGLKAFTPVVVPALAYAYAGEGGISRAWNGFAWNASGSGSGWVRGDADSLSAQY
ncbi:hypothetical protein B0F90DRAFT_1815154 [Multifurca ochricompacta]|uniref:Uncharacterized protein n=1 Tax=Multifurca ochricompacta TaxID=376703 RepID=A0AAD4M9J9_9AGAM|nr:hypothetical protein B0F90DRAFT_1815154 [Multifurca ochricompacta]